jgi:DNA replication protein DnaC
MPNRCKFAKYTETLIGQAAILQGHKVLYRETHILLEELAEATLDGSRKAYMGSVSSVALLIIDDFGMRKLPATAAEDLLEVIMRRYERASTPLTSNRPAEDWGKLLADVAAVSPHAIVRISPASATRTTNCAPNFSTTCRHDPLHLRPE